VLTFHVILPYLDYSPLDPIRGVYRDPELERKAREEEQRARERARAVREASRTYVSGITKDYDIISNRPVAAGPARLDIDDSWVHNPFKVIKNPEPKFPSSKWQRRTQNQGQLNPESIEVGDKMQGRVGSAVDTTFIDTFPSTIRDKAAQAAATAAGKRIPRAHWILPTNELNGIQRNATQGHHRTGSREANPLSRVLPTEDDKVFLESVNAAALERAQQFYRTAGVFDPIRGVYVDPEVERKHQQAKRAEDEAVAMQRRKNLSHCVLNSEGEAYNIVTYEPKNPDLAECYAAIDAYAIHHPQVRAANIARLRQHASELIIASQRSNDLGAQQCRTDPSVSSCQATGVDRINDGTSIEASGGDVTGETSTSSNATRASPQKRPFFTIRQGINAHAIESSVRERSEIEQATREQRAINRRAPRQAQGPSQNYDILTNRDYVWIPNPARVPNELPPLDSTGSGILQPAMASHGNATDEKLSQIRSLLEKRETDESASPDSSKPLRVVAPQAQATNSSSSAHHMSSRPRCRWNDAVSQPTPLSSDHR